MSDVDELWARIDDARGRLGQVDQAQVRHAEDLSERLKEIRAGLARRLEEVERRHVEVDRLRHENEQLRRMLHRLLLSIEERYNGRLKTALQEIAEQVGGLMELTEGEQDAAGEVAGEAAEEAEAENEPAAPNPPPETSPQPDGPAPVVAVEESAGDRAVGASRSEAERSALPDEDDSVWLKQIMERARELTAEAARDRDADGEPSPGDTPAGLSRSAVA